MSLNTAQPVGYCHRPELVRRCTPTGSPLTILMAPGGFGKTTLLAAGRRDVAANGVPVAWLTLADDDPGALDTYMAFALRRLGLDLLAGSGPGEVPPGPPWQRTAVLLAALDAQARPCVLALDELECVTNSRSVALLNFLLRNAPPCLHLAVAYRELPRGLDMAPHVDANAQIVTAGDLRFSNAEIARFFDLALSRQELAEVAVESGGWPIALQMRRNAPGLRDKAIVTRDAVGNWLAGGFWRGFKAADRELVLDLALFDWLDTELVEAVLERPGALRRATELPGLAGLLQPARGGAQGGCRLHPLLRDHCADQRREETPDRYRAVHGRIADALARRGATVEAMRHAVESGDALRAGDILLEAGGLQWWLREGADRLVAANRFLTDGVVAQRPQLAMVRCMILLLGGRIREANRALAAACERPPPDDRGFALDRLVAQAFLALNGSRPVVESALLAADAWRVASLPSTSRVTRSALTQGAAVYRARLAEFDLSITLAGKARKLAVGRSTYQTLTLDSLLGQMHMARGRVREALKRYRSARRLGRAGFLEDPRLGTYVDVLMRELAYERLRLGDEGDLLRLAREVYRTGTFFAYYVAAGDVAIGVSHERGGADGALAAIGELEECAYEAGMAMLVQHLGALRVSVLADADRAGEADRAWRAAQLPETGAACLDLKAHGWRGVEALACARVALFAAHGDAEASADLERALAALSAERGLKRTLMRSLALRLRLHHDARNPDGATAAAVQYLRIFRGTDYARPLIREGPAARAALEHVLDAGPERSLAAAARRLLALSSPSATMTVPSLDEKELAVLRLLVAHQDKEIATALRLSLPGVRYHVGKIFRKLGVERRQDAVRRAHALGILLADTGPRGPMPALTGTPEPDSRDIVEND